MNINDKDIFAGAILQNIIQSKIEYVTDDDTIKLPVSVLNKHVNSLNESQREAIKKESLDFYNLVVNSRGRFSFDNSLGFNNLYPFVRGMLRLFCRNEVNPIDDGKGYLYHINLPDNSNMSKRQLRKLAKISAEDAIERTVDENYLSDRINYQNIFNTRKED